MRESVSISLPTWLKERLDQTVKGDQMNRSDIVREALKEYFTRKDLERIRRNMVPLAEARGVFTDEDVFREVS
ncbi:MAG: ribbon-helix-helix protein, CopG family [Actinobacteria bacterium]|nr:ribbon-helix-helix protein, CopG family [Actinomycetota bacterium]MCG2817544.1 ribbon-helix-helix protein, CopG family [Actinomycetes bacterium]MBU4219675.1 ribbon-helix-helix protein, CopG family [Actinomycetota bacterium]MBU4359732.1 ribbon-helix-helix protein, CopG family [Actinomycetota bacterium]MBU4390990.1 ribbon-helix-helix protein, CopG family [Actinomycetota bacterium]